MTDIEFDLLDELYFVTPFSELQEALDLSTPKLGELLKQMIEKGWVKCFKSISEEQVFDATDFASHYSDYYYLATKAGLLAHNRTG